AATAMSPITVTDAATPSITALSDLRIRIPATVALTWNTALTTATLTGSGAGKVAPTVSYEDGGKTLVLNVTANFAGNDQITVTDAATPGITAANDIRIRIPATLTMTWNTGLTAATLTGSAAGKVAPTVSYEDGGKTLVLSVTTNFAGNDQLVVSGLQYMGFTAPSAADYLQLVVSGAGGGTNASDSRT